MKLYQYNHTTKQLEPIVVHGHWGRREHIRSLSHQQIDEFMLSNKPIRSKTL